MGIPGWFGSDLLLFWCDISKHFTGLFLCVYGLGCMLWFLGNWKLAATLWCWHEWALRDAYVVILAPQFSSQFFWTVRCFVVVKGI